MVTVQRDGRRQTLVMDVGTAVVAASSVLAGVAAGGLTARWGRPHDLSMKLLDHRLAAYADLFAAIETLDRQKLDVTRAVAKFENGNGDPGEYDAYAAALDRWSDDGYVLQRVLVRVQILGSDVVSQSARGLADTMLAAPYRMRIDPDRDRKAQMRDREALMDSLADEFVVLRQAVRDEIQGRRRPALWRRWLARATGVRY